MKLQELEFILSRFSDTRIFGENEHDALQFARDIVSTLRAANHLPKEFDAKDLIGLVQHKSQLPERPKSIIRLPSRDDSHYERFAILPAGVSLKSAIAAANDVIRQANKQNHNAETGGCADGDDIESNVRHGMEALGFVFLPIMDTVAWDEYVESTEVVNA